MVETLVTTTAAYIGKILIVVTGMLLGCIGVIYKINRQQIEKHESNITDLISDIQEIKITVRDIQRMCRLCGMSERTESEIQNV